MSELKISTMTIVTNLGTDIDLQDMYDKLQLTDKLVCVEYGENETKGHNMKKIKKVRDTTKPKKSFYNQATLHILDAEKTNNKPINLKIFNNGSCQMTGVPTVKSATNNIKYIKSLFHSSNVKDINCFEDNSMNICLINSGFSLNETIDRDRFYEILMDKYKFYVNYEPQSYPGINLKYYWNSLTQNDIDMCGRCVCEEYCDGKGTGEGHGECRRISIMMFESGEIIITGKCNIDQIKFIKNYVVELHKKNK